MKLFGKKDSNAAAPEELAADDLGEMDAGLDDLEGVDAPEKALSAPSRSMSGAAGGGRKNLLILVALVVVAGVGGGYFWFTGSNDSEPIHVTARTTPTTPPADMAAVAPPMPDAAMPAADPMAAAVAPATDVTAAVASAADPLAATAPAAGNPADPFAVPATDPAAVAPATDPAVAAAVLGAPPADEATAVAAMPADGTAPVEMPDDQAPDAQAAMAAPGTPDGMPPQPGAAEPAAGVMAGSAPVEAAPAESAPSWAAPGTAAVPGTTNPAANASSPNEAELAIVQHADVMDQLSRPADTQAAIAAGATATPVATAATGAPFDPSASRTVNRNAMKTVGEILEQPGIVRPLPSGYMTIRKESDAGSIDSRLTAARSALAEGNNSAALELFDDLHKDYPKDKRILMGRAVSLHKMGQKDAALSAYEDVLNRDPKNLDALSNMLGLLKEKDPQLAVEKLQELHDAYPYQGDITAQLGVAYGSAGQYDQALRYLNLAEGLKPGTGFVLYNKSVLLDKMGRGREAAVLYRQILRMAADGDIDQTLPLESIRRRLAVLQ